MESGDNPHPVCSCHGELMTWQKDKDYVRAGGRWVCRAKRREYNQRRSVQRVEWIRLKRDTNQLFRITEQLYDRRRLQKKRVCEAREEAAPIPAVAIYLRGLRHGSIQKQG